MAETSQPTIVLDEPLREADREAFDFADVPRLFAGFLRWCRTNPASALLLVALVGVVGYAYFGINAFMAMRISAARWIAAGWTAENDQQHCWGIIPVAIALVLFRWRDIATLPKRGANSGLWFVGAGLLLFVVGVRCAEARYTIFALPFLIYGTVRFLFGVPLSRIVLFPCIFLLFMTPIGGVVQGTVPLQLLTAKAIRALSTVFGIPIVVDGSNITSPDGRFPPMEVAGGCSGIRSLMAMTTLAALYAYFTMRGPIRGIVLFGSSLLFAVLGNFARVFSVVLFARFVDAKTATGLYHDYSGLVFFPVAVAAMVGFGALLNRDWEETFSRWFVSHSSKAPRPAAVKETTPTVKTAKPKKPLRYDY
jgi:exosortase